MKPVTTLPIKTPLPFPDVIEPPHRFSHIHPDAKQPNGKTGHELSMNFQRFKTLYYSVVEDRFARGLEKPETRLDNGGAPGGHLEVPFVPLTTEGQIDLIIRAHFEFKNETDRFLKIIFNTPANTKQEELFGLTDWMDYHLVYDGPAQFGPDVWEQVKDRPWVGRAISETGKEHNYESVSDHMFHFMFGTILGSLRQNVDVQSALLTEGMSYPELVEQMNEVLVVVDSFDYNNPEHYPQHLPHSGIKYDLVYYTGSAGGGGFETTRYLSYKCPSSNKSYITAVTPDMAKPPKTVVEALRFMLNLEDQPLEDFMLLAATRG
jgi:hypothetical protein